MSSVSASVLASLLLVCACAATKDRAAATEDRDAAPSCDPYACDCGLGSVSDSAGAATCVGSPLCNADDECPAAIDHSVEPACERGDVVNNGFSGHCILPCTDSCPADMACNGGRCVFARH